MSKMYNQVLHIITNKINLPWALGSALTCCPLSWTSQHRTPPSQFVETKWFAFELQINDETPSLPAEGTFIFILIVDVTMKIIKQYNEWVYKHDKVTVHYVILINITSHVRQTTWTLIFQRWSLLTQWSFGAQEAFWPAVHEPCRLVAGAGAIDPNAILIIGMKAAYELWRSNLLALLLVLVSF